MCLEGRGVPKNDSDAANWFHSAANQKDALPFLDRMADDQEYLQTSAQMIATAQFNLGMLYYHGRGVPEQRYKAVLWLRRAALREHGLAQNKLGEMYFQGDGIRQSETDAAHWLGKAAEKGIAAAQYNFGWMCEYGRGVSKDRNRARKWYRMAAEQNHPEAMKAILRLGG